MYRKLPFPVVEWPPVYTLPCPQNRLTSKVNTERGLSLAHFFIWKDFVYFDHDVLDKRKTGFIGDSYQSQDGIYKTCKNGTLYKNDTLFDDDDILVIFEDDASIAVVNVEEAIKT
jgi:hypothetical protein